MNPGKMVAITPARASAAGLSIGTFLIQAGRLTLEDANRILEMQRERGLRFGEAAVELGLLSQADIDYALSRQFDYPYLVPGEGKVDASVKVAYEPFGDIAKMFGTLRGQLILRWFDDDPDHRTMAVVSAQRYEGRSFVAANLAVSFAQLGQKTLLVDADMRNPGQHLLFDVNNQHGLSAVLSGRMTPETVVQPVDGLPDLFVLPAGAVPPNPLELLSRPLFGQVLAELSKNGGYDIILLDSPAASEYSDAQSIATGAGAALIVARKNSTRVWKVRGVSDRVSHASTSIIGAVLNEF